MSDRDALLNAIAARPEEDTPRFMYADWLEENGEPERADFVRTQVLIAQPGLTPAEKYPLVKKNVFYLTNRVREWKAQLPPFAGIEWGDFNRGLIEEVRATDERPVLKHAAVIFAVPGVHVLRLWRLADGGALARVPELERLRVLRVISGTSAVPLLALFDSPHLRNLTALDLHNNRANDATAALLADGRFPHLAELHLSGNDVRDAGALALARSPHLDGLRVLDVCTNYELGHDARQALRAKFGKRVKL
jgi:uncharacterized protein (TIGR02996 family)